MSKHEKAVIVGTAPSWKRVPWQDTSLRILGLNDAYQLPGWLRSDEWYDIHPLDKFVYPPEGKKLFTHQVPPGHYVRPREHLAWLAKQTIPIWLHDEPPTEWLHASRFPKEQIEQHFGRYFTSTPAWMLAHVILQGYREIHIYGIHLSTEHEYIEQRPNFEFLLGRVLGPEPARETVDAGVRRYETASGVVVLPVESPLLQSPFQYAYQPRPRSHLEPLKWELHKIGVKQQRVAQQLMDRKPWTRTGRLRDELARLRATALDYQQQMERLQLQAQM